MSDQNLAQEALVRLDKVGVYRDGKWLVRGVTFDVHPKEIVTLIGPNGSGKSTSVKTALGVLQPTEGEVIRRPDLQIGYVPQKFNLDWTLPMPVSRLMKLTKKQTEHDIDHALDLVGISHLKKSDMQSLSGGETQRALLARALLMQPDLLVLDEPVQGVDFAGEIALYDLIKTIRDETGCGILLISHDLHVVMAQTDTVICLNGHVCCRGTPKLVAESDEYKRLFGARAAQSLAVYQHDHDHTHLPDGRVMHADGTIHDHCDHGQDRPHEKEHH